MGGMANLGGYRFGKRQAYPDLRQTQLGRPMPHLTTVGGR
jgi:hypothetical protein